VEIEPIPVPEGEEVFVIDDSELLELFWGARCMSCKHFRGHLVGFSPDHKTKFRTCEAFRYIPDPIWQGRNDHTKPYTGDRDYQYAPIELVEQPDTVKLGSQLSGNWAHTGLEDVHGGSDPGGGLGGPEGRTAQFLKLTEDRIVRSSVEIAVCVDPETGNQVFAYTGDEQSVRLPNAATVLMRDKVFTHNHPSHRYWGWLDHEDGAYGSAVNYDEMTPPGQADLRAAATTDLREMRVITEKWEYSISRPPGPDGWNTLYSLGRGKQSMSVHELFLDAHNMVDDEAHSRIMAMYDLPGNRPTGQDVRDIENKTRHEAWKLVDKWTNGDLQYTTRARHPADVSPEAKKAKLDEGLHQLGSSASGNWAHTGLEDVHGGSDPGGGVGTPAGRFARVTKMTEDRIVRNPYETGVCINPNTGEPIFAYKGGADHVYLPVDARPLMKGMVFTHNHPSGSSFSRADLICAAREDLAGMRAVGERYTYTIQRPDTPDGWQTDFPTPVDASGEWLGASMVMDIRDLMEHANEYAYSVQRPLVDQGVMTAEEASTQHNHLMWSKVDGWADGAFQYERKPRHSDDVKSTLKARKTQLDEGLHQLGSPASGNWAHTGLEDVHGGSDPGGGVGTVSGRTARIVKMTEDRIVRSRLEIGVCIDPNTGEQIFAYTGNEYSIRIPTDVRSKMAGMVLTHNHPSGRSFSGADLRAASYDDVSEIRAVGERYTYSMRRPETLDGWDTSFDPPDWHGSKPIDGQIILDDLFDRAEQEVVSQLRERVGKGELTAEGAAEQHSHLVWTRVDEMTNGAFQYERKPRHSDDVKSTLKARTPDFVKKGW